MNVFLNLTIVISIHYLYFFLFSFYFNKFASNYLKFASNIIEGVDCQGALDVVVQGLGVEADGVAFVYEFEAPCHANTQVLVL